MEEKPYDSQDLGSTTLWRIYGNTITELFQNAAKWASGLRMDYAHVHSVWIDRFDVSDTDGVWVLYIIKPARDLETGIW